MKLSSLLVSTNLDIRLHLLRFHLVLYYYALFVNAFTFRKAPAVNLNLADLGRTAFAGDFIGISVYEFEGQSQNGYNKNGSQSIIARLPNGGFTNLASSDASIQAMCLFVTEDKEVVGVIVGGNFTDLGGVESPGVALFNPNTSSVLPLPGISGQVSTLLCDQASNTVYLGGSFKGSNSTNAIMWVGTAGWKNLPFGGFNGPITSITKISNGHIVFGGSFTGLGNMTGPSLPDQAVVNIVGANIIASPSSSNPEFSDPKKILCKSSPEDEWLLADQTPGFWRADFGFNFQPTKLRIHNAHRDGRGTKTFRYIASPINGIMNLTYIDPDTNQLSSCSNECPLSSNANVPFQDFYFVNVIGMNGFQIDISQWYGNGGGLGGIELFQNDIYAYAINDFNEPTCIGAASVPTSSSTGPWVESPSLQSSSEFLTATISSAQISSINETSITFKPNIRQSGNYSVNMYTPGCIQDSSCPSRGRVNITGMVSTSDGADFSLEIFQTNNFDKYDQIYFGHIDASSSSFQPSVTLKLSAGQEPRDYTLVAQRVGFTLISPSVGLNNIFEYDPTENETNANKFDKSIFDMAGTNLPLGSDVQALQTVGDATFVGGNFSKNGLNNIFQISGTESRSVPGEGLNGAVHTMLVNDTTLYVGGAFSNTADGKNPGLASIAALNTATNSWNALGAGVNGSVLKIVPLQVNVTNNRPEMTIALTGEFTQVLGFDQNPSFSVAGFAIWVPSLNNWLHNLREPTMLIDGSLTASADLPDGSHLLAGSISSSQLGTVDVAEINIAGTALKPLSGRIQPSNAQLTGANASQNSSGTPTGVITGLFYARNDRNFTILGGHFSTTGTNGSEVNNLSFIDGSEDDAVSGVGPSIFSESTILAMSVEDDVLYAGGSLIGNVNGANVSGLISYDLVAMDFGTQPPSLDGDVHTIVPRRSTKDIYVGGNFSSAGSLSCPAVCLFSTTFSQWNRPGSGLQGSANTMVWANPTSLIVGGNLKLNDVTSPLVTFNTKSQVWTAAVGADGIPGPVDKIAKASSDSSQLWVSGFAVNGSAFLMKFDGTSWTSISDLLGSNTHINGLEVLPFAGNHVSSGLVSASSVLLVLGDLNLPGFGSVSGALFNGTSFQPYILTSSSQRGGGSLSQLFTEKDNQFRSAGGKLAIGFVVLISLAFALVLIMIVIVIGLFVERTRRKREGYAPAPTNSYDRGTTITGRVPPDQLFGSIGQGGRKTLEKQAALI